MENNNILHNSGGTIIINGGNALQGCPNDWDEAALIIEKLNKGYDNDNLKWSFDCGFKLDFDGDILSVCSRFYPPKTHYGPTWDGHVSIYFMGEKISDKEFDCPTLDELKIQVDSYILETTNKVKSKIKKLF